MLQTIKRYCRQTYNWLFSDRVARSRGTNVSPFSSKQAALSKPGENRIWSFVKQPLTTILTAAVTNGWHRTARTMLRLGLGDVQVKDIAGKTLLHFAAERGDLAIVKVLSPYLEDISTGSLPFFSLDNDLKTPLHCAAEYGRENIIHYYLKKTEYSGYIAQILTQKQDRHGMTPLLYALRYRHFLTVYVMCDFHSNRDQYHHNLCFTTQDQDGKSALHYAAINAAITVRYLENILGLVKGDLHLFGLVSQKDNAGNTPLFYAAKNDKASYSEPTALKMLRIPNIHNEFYIGNALYIHNEFYIGNTLLHYAVQYLTYGSPEDREAAIRTIIKANPNLIYKKNIEGRLPLDTAIVSKYFTAVNILLESDYPKGELDQSLILAADALDLDEDTEKLQKIILILEKLLQKGANPNTKSDDGSTAIMLLARRNCIAGINLLVAYGADVSLRNDDGMTALNYAVNRNAVETVKLLLKLNPDLASSKDESGRSILHYASQSFRDRDVSSSYKLEYNAIWDLFDAGATPNEQDMPAIEMITSAGTSTGIRARSAPFLMKPLLYHTSNFDLITPFMDFSNWLIATVASSRAAIYREMLLWEPAYHKILDDVKSAPYLWGYYNLRAKARTDSAGNEIKSPYISFAKQDGDGSMRKRVLEMLWGNSPFARSVTDAVVTAFKTSKDPETYWQRKDLECMEFKVSLAKKLQQSRQQHRADATSPASPVSQQTLAPGR